MSVTLKNAATFQIVGPSGCGKTYFTLLLIKFSDQLFENPMRKVFWLMGSEDGEHGETSNLMENIGKDITYMYGFPKGWQSKLKSGDAIVIDDLFIESTKEKDFNNLFTKVARHRSVTVIFFDSKFISSRWTT